MSKPEKLKFTWKVDNYSMLMNNCKKGDILKSPFFKCKFFDEDEWCLQLYPKGTQAISDHMYCRIVRKNTFARTIRIRCSFKLKTPENIFADKIGPYQTELQNSFGVKLFGAFEQDYEATYQDVLTIKCHLWNPENKVLVSPLFDNLKIKHQYCAFTQNEVGKRCATFVVPKILGHYLGKHKSFLQVADAFEGTPSFELAFFFCEDRSCKYGHIDIRQTNIAITKNIFVKCKVIVMCSGKEYQHSKEAFFLYHFRAGQIWHFPDFISTGNLMNGRYLHLDGTLHLFFQLTYLIEGAASTQLEIPRYQHNAFEVPKPLTVNHLKDNVYNLFWNQKFCDVKLVVGDKTLLAHKVVMCARSPVFRAMFENDTEEKNTNVIKIDDFDDETVGRMLKFLHSDDVNEYLPAEDCCDLYSCADKYQISPLKQWCTRYLLRSLNLGSVCDTLILADKHKDFFLMSFVLNYITNNAMEVFHYSEWERHLDKNPILFGNTMMKVVKNISLTY